MLQYIGFHLHGSEYAIPITKVREIINLPEITTLPDSPAYLQGVTNLRGSVIPIVNIKRLMQLPEIEQSAPKVIVIASGKMTFGVLVDDITGVENIDDASIESPESMRHGRVEQVEGVAKLGNRLVVLLDPKKLIPLQDQSMLEDVNEDFTVSSSGDIVEVRRTVQTMGGTVQVKEFHDAKQFFEKKVSSDSNDPRLLLFNEMMAFMDAISGSDYERADSIMQGIIKDSQGDLYKEVGKVTRKLHDALKSFHDSIDPKLRDLATTDMPNAKDKLEFVIKSTEEAANKTMGIVEKYIASMDTLSGHISKLQKPADSVQYLKAFQAELEEDMNAVLMTQSFQDLTGQTIKKVIALVSNLERELVELIATFGVKLESITETEQQAVVSEKVSQSDVDDLLKEFGF
ncbi:MAG: hypothetical protein FIA97_06740 [Methylococcaceae bacterium]|nr:hypothetical protein [Desulfuromonas sp.]NJD06180.1 hypothetical protein [Methylococcaceae bacterium]